MPLHSNKSCVAYILAVMHLKIIPVPNHALLPLPPTCNIKCLNWSLPFTKRPSWEGNNYRSDGWGQSDQRSDPRGQRSKFGAKKRCHGDDDCNVDDDDDPVWHCLAACKYGESSHVKEAYKGVLERVQSSLLKRTGGRLRLPLELFAVVNLHTSQVDEDLIDHFELMSLSAAHVELSYEVQPSHWFSEPWPTRFDSRGQHRAWLARNKPHYSWKAMRVLYDAQPQEAAVAPVTVSGLCQAGLVRLKHFPALGANVHYYVPSRTTFLLSHDTTDLFLFFSLLGFLASGSWSPA